ncbi:MAG: ABC transporter permease [Oscillospiraceae bacterium]
MKQVTSKTIEKRFEVIKTIVAMLIAILIAFIVIAVVSEDPFEALRLFVLGPLETTRRMGNIIEKMIPLMFTGVAIAIMYKANQFNLVVEGAFFFSASIAAYLAINLSLPPFIHPIVGMLVAGLIGSACAFIPAILKIKFKANEVVSSIMLNYVLLYAGTYVLLYLMRDEKAGFNGSYQFKSTVKLPNIWPGTRVHLGFFIGVLVVVFAYIFLYKTKWGYAIRIVGENKDFAKYSGISVVSVIIYCQLIGGFVAGVGGAVEQYGMYDRFQWSALPNYGWDGVLVSVLAKNNPIFVPITALFLSYIRVGAEVMSRSTDVPVEFVNIIQAIIIMLIAAQMFLSKWKHRMVVENSSKSFEKKEDIK